MAKKRKPDVPMPATVPLKQDQARRDENIKEAERLVNAALAGAIKEERRRRRK